MDYYASWPRSSVPKWVGVTLGGIFTLIVVVCAGMIVHLLRPPKHAPPPVVATATPAQPRPAAATVATPAIAPAPDAQPAPVASPAVAQIAKKRPTHAHKRAILAKHDGKAGRSAKSDLDRLLGL
jgi:pyruvate/2-oxoglutarate dehydrogenase complex dihydrolipoamide acyltransferase (E2) component